MLATAQPKTRKPLVGSPRPRVGPPIPLRHELAEYLATAQSLGITPMPWQETAAKYLTAKGADRKFLYREVAVVVGRQNGKTTLAKPLIVQRLKAGRHIMHIAQVRELPRIMFEAIADALEAEDPNLFPKRRGKIIWPRRGAGSESIVLTNGGSYRIAAAVTGGARGHSIDDLIIDELREMETWDVVNSAKPAQRFAEDPQTVYLSNMGTERSVVLNSLQKRAAEDRWLAYMEWSADPEYTADDIRGWLQSNPAIGHYPQVLADLEKDYLAAKLGGNLAGFDSEALCRKVPSLEAALILPDIWGGQAFGDLPSVTRPVMAVKMDISGERAGAVLAWQGEDKRVSLEVVADVTGSPIDVNEFAPKLVRLAQSARVVNVAYDPYTDADLARFFKKAKAVNGRDYANASEGFVRRAKAREFNVREMHDGQIAADLAWTVRKSGQYGSYIAVKADDEHTNVVAEAAIRAAWLATTPQPFGPARIS